MATTQDITDDPFNHTLPAVEKDGKCDRQQSSSPDVSASEATTVQRTNVPGFQMHDHGYSQWADGSVRAGGGVMEQGTSDSDDRGGQVEAVLDNGDAKALGQPPVGLQAQAQTCGAGTLELAQREEPGGQDTPGNLHDGTRDNSGGGEDGLAQPVKRGRGRPRKKQRGVGGRFPKAQPEEAPPPVKRGRGRPRKSESAAANLVRPPPEPPVVPDIDLMPKSSRGRPRKVRKLDSDDEAPARWALAANRLSVNGVFGERRTVWQKDDGRERLPLRRPLDAMANTSASGSEFAALGASDGTVVKAEPRDGTADSADDGGMQSLVRSGVDASVGERGSADPRDGRAQAPAPAATSGMVRNVAGDLVKRGRGRPRKHPLVPPPAPPAVLDLAGAKARLDDDHAPVDNPYGRPDVATSSGAPVQVKRPRGRPPKRRGRPAALPAADGEGATKADQQDGRRDAVGGIAAPDALYTTSQSGPLSSLVYNRLLAERLMLAPEHQGMDVGQHNPLAASLAANALLSALLGTAKPAASHDAFGRPLAAPGYDKVLPLVFQGAYVSQHGHLLPAATYVLPAQAMAQAPPRDPHGLLGAVGYLLGES